MKTPDINAKEWALFILKVILFVLFVLTLASTSMAQSRDDMEIVIRELAQAKGIDGDLAVAIAEVESGLNPNALGDLGEIGIYQLRPEFHPKATTDVYQNANVAIGYLVKLKKRCADYGDAFFVCFNHGPYKRVKYPRLFPYYVKVRQAQRQLAGRN